MALKNVAVGYSDSANSREALRAAIVLCERHGASLTGVHIRVPVTEEPQIQSWVPPDLLDKLRAASRDSVGNAERGFREHLEASGFSGPVAWVSEDGDVNERLARLARCFDLLVIGQFSDPGETARFRVRAEFVVIRSGRPLLVVPSGYQVAPQLSDHVVVAWDASRPAARALADAVHLFGATSRFDVISVVSRLPDDDAPVAPGHDVMRYLAQQGVDARRQFIAGPRRELSSTLLDYCADRQPDLLVMGAYSHARLRDQLFGSVTGSILEKMNLPVLMSH